MTEPAFPARKVLLRHGSVGGVLLLIGLAAFVWGTFNWLAARNLERNGVWTTGEVISRSTRTSTETGNRRHRIRYQFEDAAGQEHARMVTVNAQRYRSMWQGRSLQILYLPDQPSVSAAEFEDRGRRGLVFGLFGLCLLVIGGGIVLHQRPVIAAKLRAARAPSEPAQVIAHHPCRGSTRYMPKLNLEWQDGTGRTGTNIGVDAGHAPAVGTEIRLRRDPVTGQAWWEGDLG